ncbi:MAG: putative membrane protein YozB [Bacteroidia bacterium]|nr:MAG: putative membrane protein YozB [Bacteroidia bacterium]
MKSEKSTKILITILTIIVLAIVIILNKKFVTPPSHIPEFIYHLPLLNAILNSTSFILLIFSLLAIKQKKINVHKNLNLLAFILSAIFLISYVVAHFYLPETIYGDANHNGILEENEKIEVGLLRKLYLLILSTHIIFATVAFPLILLSFYYGLNNKILQHQKIVRFAYPLWLYVCFTGPIVYLFLRPYYGF